MDKPFSCYDYEFQDLVYVNQNLEREHIKHKANIILTENARFDQKLSNSEKYQFNDEDTEHFLTFCRKIQSNGGRTQNVFSAMTFSTWVDLFLSPQFGTFSRL